MRTITGLGDRLLARLAPKALAHATVCHTEYVCKVAATSKCPRNVVRLRRLVCTDGSTGRWLDAGCCY